MNESTVEPSVAHQPASGRATTLMDVARSAGVSHVAVSVVLSQNPRSKVRVSEATRQRILDAARDLNYHPNVLARSLRQRRTNVIGFYAGQGKIFSPTYPFYGNLLEGLLHGCQDHRKSFLMNGLYHTDSEDDVYQELLNGQLDGLVLYAREMTPLIQRLIESRLPLVSVANEIPGVPCVTIDNKQGGQLLARYLSQKGYQKAFFRVADAVLPATLEERFQSFRAEGLTLGLEVERFYAPPFMSGIFHLVEEIIASAPRGSQVIACYNDSSADGIFAMCQEQAVQVPQEIALTGFDGFLPGTRPAARLTTIRAPWAEVARKAVGLLVAQCNGESVPMRTILPVELVVGDTA